jgi:hypothetical protein
MPPRFRIYIFWYFVETPLRIISRYAEYACALLDIIPFWFLIKTLLSPWKNILDRTPRHRLDFKRMFEALCLNLLARGTGCVVRILTIIMGIVLHILVLGFTVLYLVVWLAFPLATLFGIALMIVTIR